MAEPMTRHRVQQCQFCGEKATHVAERISDGKVVHVCKPCWNTARACYKTWRTFKTPTIRGRG